MIKCPLTGSTKTRIIYRQDAVPLIQNKVYSTRELARNAPASEVVLAQSEENGFVFSAEFKEFAIDYDQHYQNEQSNSPYFRKHLDHVIEIMQNENLLSGKVVEIGCGKAFFLELLLNIGVNITGFDPTYEGKLPQVIKDYFSEKYSGIGADLIILRHTLEHISNPLDFIKTIAKANNYRGKIFIEVPTFEWIVAHNATEDIFYEHCNYFTLQTLQMLFAKSKGGHFFNGQYIYVIADLSDVRDEPINKDVNLTEVKFRERVKEYRSLLDKLDQVAIWGAGAKGSTFLNLSDRNEEKIKFVIDINPKKQGKYIGGTGHLIIRPEDLGGKGIKNIIVMNENYIEEIKTFTQPLGINLITL